MKKKESFRFECWHLIVDNVKMRGNFSGIRRQFTKTFLTLTVLHVTVRGDVEHLAEAAERNPSLPGERDVEVARCQLLERVDGTRLTFQAQLTQKLALKAQQTNGRVNSDNVERMS